MNPLDYRPSYRRRLPHLQPPGATLFVTFRLAGSIPKSAFQKWSAEKARMQKSLELIEDSDARNVRKRQYQREWFRKSEAFLDKESHGPLWLKDERAARIVMGAMRFMDGKVFSLDAFCVMANHVHVVFAPLAIQSAEVVTETRNSEDCFTYHSLASIMHSLKGFTSNKINKALERSGQFWARETFDHFVRDEHEFARIIKYVLHNPVKAGLVKQWSDWPYSYCRT